MRGTLPVAMSKAAKSVVERAAFTLSVLLLRQSDWRRRRDAFHAPMNHDSRISESGY
jgi:hypothetical protein